MLHAFCLFRYHSLHKTSSAQSCNKAIMQTLKVLKAFCSFCLPDMGKIAHWTCTQTTQYFFPLFFPFYHPMFRSYCICEEAVSLKSMPETDVETYSMNICMLLPRIPFMLFYHLQKLRWSEPWEMKSKAYACQCAKWILMTFNEFRKTKEKKIYSAKPLKVKICSLRAHSCLTSSKLFIFLFFKWRKL